MGSKHKKNKAKKTQSKQTASSEAQVYTNQRVRAPCAGLSTQTSRPAVLSPSTGSRALTGSRFSKSLVHND